MKDLTKAEDEVMQILWKLENAFVKDIISRMPKPKPAYNTVSTIVRILEQKGFVDHEVFGKSHRYFPLIPKSEYRTQVLKNLVSKYFEGSISSLVSAFVKQEKINPEELEKLIQQLKEQEHE